ncbi:MAG: PLP-dependent transferase, partial [Pseudomonadota bacterium]
MKKFKPRTKLVHGGTRRSQYGEVAEAIFLTQGFVYDSAEAAEARFIQAGEDEFIYARYGNPTTRRSQPPSPMRWQSRPLHLPASRCGLRTCALL